MLHKPLKQFNNSFGHLYLELKAHKIHLNSKSQELHVCLIFQTTRKVSHLDGGTMLHQVQYSIANIN